MGGGGVRQALCASHCKIHTAIVYRGDMGGALCVSHCKIHTAMGDYTSESF